MEHLSKEDAKWLIEEYGPRREDIINVENFKMFLKAYNLMKNTNRRMGCFTCEARQVTKMTVSYFEQHEQTIRDIAYPKKGRKKKNV